MRVLGIETSCDETGVAIYDSVTGRVNHLLYSQIALHAEYGGVVPELASRDHVQRLVPMIRDLLETAEVDPATLDGIGYTAGPGLLGALMTGAALARSLAFGWGVPAVAVHHMEGHLLAPMLEANPPEFPFVALLVSGGHSQLFAVRALGQYELLGESVDDAVGEAFDKVGKMLGMNYPGGPAVAKAAEQGDAKRFQFPRPMIGVPGLNMSFSGLKTAVMNTIKSLGGVDELSQQEVADIAAGFQWAAIDTLMIKCRRALKETGLKRLVVAGGVSANQHLRSHLREHCEAMGVEVFYPRPEWSTDNGAMIAYAAYCKLGRAEATTDLAIELKPRWPLVDY